MRAQGKEGFAQVADCNTNLLLSVRGDLYTADFAESLLLLVTWHKKIWPVAKKSPHPRKSADFWGDFRPRYFADFCVADNTLSSFFFVLLFLRHNVFKIFILLFLRKTGTSQRFFGCWSARAVAAARPTAVNTRGHGLLRVLLVDCVQRLVLATARNGNQLFR